MNWKLILQLSLFGLAMGVGTVFWIPSNIEPLFWLVGLSGCAYLIAKRAAGREFGHGFLLGLANSVWVTGSHVLLFDHYVANHPQEMAQMAIMPLAQVPRVLMVVVGLLIGVVSGLVIGLFAVIAARLVRRRSPGPETPPHPTARP